MHESMYDVEVKSPLNKFSVLMSVYYKENATFFKEALDSILVTQELKPNEFVLVVDGPVTSELDAIIEDYEKKYADILRVYRLESNCGLGKALYFGLNNCSYNLVARADSDDINSADRFRVQIEEYRNDSSLDVLGSFIDEFYEDCNEPINHKIMPTLHDTIVKMSKFRNPINHMTVMFKKSAIIAAGSYEHLPYLEDYYLWIRVLANGGRFKNIDKNLVHVRVGNGMLKRRSNKNYISSWKKLNQYMIDKRMIGPFGYLRNIISIIAFIYMPISLKRIAYKVYLRN